MWVNTSGPDKRKTRGKQEGKKAEVSYRDASPEKQCHCTSITERITYASFVIVKKKAE